MSTYETHLREAFDYQVALEKETLKKVTAFLIEEGASFAVTQDAPNRLWLSQASAKLLVDKDWSTL